MILFPDFSTILLRTRQFSSIYHKLTASVPIITYLFLKRNTPNYGSRLAQLRAGETVDLASLVIGRIPGTIGEVSVIALLIGAIYMVVRKVISPVIPLIYIGTVFVFTFLFGGFNLTYSLSEICAGGLIYGAFFMATDYVTSPLTPKGQIVYGLILGIVTGIFRLWGASPEGVSYAIIFSNLLVPLIERYTLPTAFGKGGQKK